MGSICAHDGARTIARLWSPFLEGHCPTGDELRLGQELVDDGGRDRRAGGEDHHGAVVLGLVRGVAHGGRGDVDTGVTERGADAADHAGNVAVLEEREMLFELKVEALVPRFEEMWAVARAEHRADYAVARAATDDGDPQEVGEVPGVGIAGFGDLDTPLLRE